MVLIFVFIFGAIIGSFLNVIILRYNTGESIIYSGSRCFSCGKKLSWYELIPIFSFLIQKGRCRHCGSKISLQYPIVEALTGLIFLLVFWRIWGSGFGIFGQLIYYWVIFALFIIISIYDIRHQIIPNGLVYFLIFLSLFSFVWDFGNWNLFGNWKLIIENSALIERILSGIAFFGLFGLLWFVSHGRWMGLGDAKMALAIGWLLGSVNGFIAILASFWIGAIFGVFLLLFAPKKFKMKSRIPFGPFLGLGALVAFLFGNNILQIYPPTFL
jgi:leader peptidase (prepilin peptidase)/N-methyltransferase